VRRIPIRLRVAAAFAVAMAVVLAGMGWFIHARLGAKLSDAQDRQLLVRAQDLTGLVEREGSLTAATDVHFIEPGESYAQLLDTEGHVIDATPPLGQTALLDAEELRAAREGMLFAEREQVRGLDEQSRLLATPLERNGQQLVLVVGATSEDRAETLSSLLALLLIAGPVALGLATMAGYVLAGLSLHPVESMRGRAAAISAETPGKRLPVPATHDEIELLGHTLNAMLERLESAIERERDFVADAGHELRTPLSLLRTELELALRQGKSEDELRDALRSASQEAERLSQLAEDLLLIARADRGRLDLRVEPMDVDELFASVVSRFEWRAEDAERPLQAQSASGLRIDGDRLRLEQALANLVDNALRYGEGLVRLWATEKDGNVQLHVTDEGRGFPPDFLDRAFERFTRSDPARGRGGAGLGLSIVKAIAQAHGGTAGAANPPKGGVDAWISLPAVVPIAPDTHAARDELETPA
jgi:two-component system, OmpR family, sensor kinase